MAFEFFPERSGAIPADSQGLLEQSAGPLEGIPRAIATAVPRAALKTAETAHILATGAEPGLTPDQRDAQFKRIEDTYRPYIEQLSPHPYDTGRAGEVLGGFLESMSGLLTRGGAKAVVAPPALSEGTELVRQGVDAGTAAAAVGGMGVANAVGFSIPFLGKTLASRVLSGIAGNTAVGAGTDAWMHSLLESGGYADLAKQYDPFNGQARILDAMIGGAFGGLAHHLEGGKRLDPEVADAVLQLNRLRQATRDSLPGAPGTPADLVAHTRAVDRATEQLAAGDPVDVAGNLAGRQFGSAAYLENMRKGIAKMADKAYREALGEMEPVNVKAKTRQDQQQEPEPFAAKPDRSALTRSGNAPEQAGGTPRGGLNAPKLQIPAITTVPDVRDMAAALEASRVSSIGDTTTVQTERGSRVGVRYALIEADKLRTSHSDEMQPSKNYDQRLQPRERERAASEAQVARIAGKLDFNRLAENPSAADGAPIIGPDDQVESGNARSIAVRRAYKSGQANGYRQALLERASSLGIDPQTVAQMREPVLVRQRVSTVTDRALFAIEANEQAQARMSLAEQARIDASRISSLDGLVTNDDGSINMRDSKGFIRRFVGDAVAPTDQGALMRGDGSLSTEGTARLRNAIFARAYGDPELVSMLVEGGDQNVRNILTGLSRAAGDMADIRQGVRERYYQPLDISQDVAAAARLFTEIRREGISIPEYLAKQVLFEPIPHIQQELLQVFDHHARSGRRIGEVLTRYADIVRAQGNPGQGSFLSDAGTGYSKESILAEAAKEMEPGQTRETAQGTEKPLAEAVDPQETVEGKQAAAVVASNPDVMVAFDEGSILSGAEAMAQADADLAEAERMASLFDAVTTDLAAAEHTASYLEQRRAPFNPDQIDLDFTSMPAAGTAADAIAGSRADVDRLAMSPNELARAVAKEFKNAQSAAIVGQKVKSVHDLAVIAQVYRNPQFETMRYVFVNPHGEIVHATGVSSRMVGEASIFARRGELSTPEGLNGILDRLGEGTKFYVVHNHPSGDPKPSEADMRVTQNLHEQTGGRLIGHVVVNHGKYAVIDGFGFQATTHEISNASLRTRPMDHPVLGQKILSQSDLPKIATQFRDTVKEGSLVMIARATNGEVSGIVEVPMAYLRGNPLRLAAAIRRYKLNSGSHDVALVGDRELLDMAVTRKGIASDLLLDVVDWQGHRSLRSIMNGADNGMKNGKLNNGDTRKKALEVKDEGATYDEGKANPYDTLTTGQKERMRGMFHEKLRYLQSVKLRGFDPAINKMSEGELAREASRQASQDLVDEATEKKRRVALATVAADRNAAMQDIHPDGKMRGLVSMMVRDRADHGSTQSFESREMAKRSMALAQLMPALEATNPKLFGLVEDRAGWRDLVREIYGEKTGNKAAADGAKAWLKVMEDLRTEANYSGFDIAKLVSYRLPQSHGRKALAAAGVDKWVADILPKLDRERYVSEKGQLLTDKEMQEFLGQAYENIVTNGMNSLEPGAYRGGGSIVNKYQEHRAIHFKRADDYVDYLAAYGEEGSVHGVITGHVTRMARDIALVETFGPNPDKAFQVLMDRAAIAGDKDTAQFAQNLFHEISGKTTPGEVPTWAEYSQGVRNLLVSTKLGSAAVSSITDNATLHITAQLNNLSSMQLFRNQLQAFNPLTKADRDIARANGLGLDIFTQSLNRWGEEGLGSNMSGKLAAGTLRLSGLQAMTEANKRAFGVTMMSAIGKLVRGNEFKALGESDNRILASKGVSAQDFAVWKKAKLEDWGNGNDSILSPQAIARIPDAELVAIAPEIPPAQLRNQAITRLLGAVLEETDNAVITSGYRERALLRQGTERGSVAGELARHITLFKSFPVAMISKHWSRALSMPTMKGKVAYATALFGALTILGAVGMSIKDLVAGKDPRSFRDPRTWLAAMAQGGGLGIYGDYLFSDQSRYGNSLTASLAGPAAGTMEDIYKLTLGNVHQAIRGETTHAAAEAVQFAKGNVPLINLWYTKAALDRLILNDLQDYLSPGYLSRVRQNTRKTTGQEYWWEPGNHSPARAPDLGAMVAQP